MTDVTMRNRPSLQPRAATIASASASPSLSRYGVCDFLRMGASLSSCSIRSAAPSRSSYWPLFSDHMKAASAVTPRPSAIGIR